MKTLITLSIVLFAFPAYAQVYMPPIGSQDWQVQKQLDDISDQVFNIQMERQRGAQSQNDYDPAGDLQDALDALEKQMDGN